MTNEQINRLASELLGECWHDEGDPNNVAAHKRCSKCHHLAYDSFTDGVKLINEYFSLKPYIMNQIPRKDQDDRHYRRQVGRYWDADSIGSAEIPTPRYRGRGGQGVRSAGERDSE